MDYKNQFLRQPPRLQDKELVNEFRALYDALKIEFEAISKARTGGTTVRISSGGGGGSSSSATVNIRYVTQAVTSGDNTINFTDVGTTSYMPIGDLLTLVDGQLNRSIALPLIPPYATDTRTTSSVQFRVFDSGTIHAIILVPS